MTIESGRLLGLDYGKKRIGLAVSDALGLTAHPLKALERTTLQKDLAYLDVIIADYDVTCIVVGLPLHMNGSAGPMVQSMRAFMDHVARRTGIPIVETDERLTTFQAEEYLNAANIRGKKRKARIDSIAAQIILKTYMDSI